jgi:3-oxoacyl-[acyl-carrier protein] reductase
MPVLQNQIALITGAGRGIGRAIALDLARAGCHLALAGRNADALATVAKEAAALNVKSGSFAVDLAEDDAATGLVDRVNAELGQIDILINNAALLLPAPLLEVTSSDWDATMAVNLRSAFFLSQRVLKGMVTRRSGYIINISSTVAYGVKADVAAYGASKCALAGLSEALYAAGKPHGVRVSTVYPGVTDTPMIRDLNGDNSVGSPDQWMQPEDISSCVLFLLNQSPRMVVKEITPWAAGYDRI